MAGRKKVELNDGNYYSNEMGKKYCSVSQLKDFYGCAVFDGCQARAMAILNGEYEKPKTDALLLGSYVDCALLEPQKLDKFKEEHPEMYSSRGATAGQLKSTFLIADKMIERVKRDEFFMKTLDGNHQTIMTANIFGVPFKIKMDTYAEGRFITDLKTTQSIRKSYFDTDKGTRVNFIEAYDYILQGAIYQKVVELNTGKKLPFFISAVSKENEPDIEVIQIDNDTMADRLEQAEAEIRQIKLIKSKKIEPIACGYCDYCKSKKKLSKPINWVELGGLIE